MSSMLKLGVTAFAVFLFACPNANPAATCTAPKQACGALCIDLTSDAANCGRCLNACNDTLTCQAGVCTCPNGTRNCGGLCRSVLDDESNCGACGAACAAGQTCNAGACVPAMSGPSGNTCAANELSCGGVCTNVTTTTNCGACGASCESGRVCADGACKCPEGQQLCNGACIPITDNANCGACGSVCTSGFTCNASSATSASCTCSGLVCGTQCLDPNTSAAACGSCSNVCGTGANAGKPICFYTQGCVASPPAVTIQNPQQTYGLTVAGGGPLRFTFGNTHPNATYQCRSGVAAALPAFSACDGASGVGAFHTPPVAAGQRRTEVKTIIPGAVSQPVTTFDYYVHPSLNGVTPCPSTGLSDENAFAIAGPELGNPATAFNVGADFSPPFMNLTFPNSYPTKTMVIHQHDVDASEPNNTYGFHYDDSAYPGWSGPGPSPDFRGTPSFTFVLNGNTFTEGGVFGPLRHRFALNSTRTILLLARSYPASQSGINCQNRIELGNSNIGQSTDCAAFVVAANGGKGVCLGPTGAVLRRTKSGWAKLVRPVSFSPKCTNVNPGTCPVGTLHLPP